MKRSVITLSILGLLFTLTLTTAGQLKSVKNTKGRPSRSSLVENQNLAGSTRVRQNSLMSTYNQAETLRSSAGRRNSLMSTFNQAETLSSNTTRRTGRTETTVDKNETITVHGRSSRVNSITFEGNDEPLWAKGAATQQLVQGNQIGTNVRPRRTGLYGDSNGDSNVDAADYVLRSSSQKNNVSGSRRSGLVGGDFNPDQADTVARSSTNSAGRQQALTTVGSPRPRQLSGDFNNDADADGADFLRSTAQKQRNKAAGPQSLTAITFGRGGRQNSLMGLLIP